MRSRLVLISAIALIAADCSTYTMTSSSTLAGPVVSDSDIGSIMLTANQGEIDQGNAALARASSADVRSFAQMMVDDHTNALNDTNNLLSRRGITPSATNDLSATLKSGSQQTISALNTYSGTAFDRQYIDSQVNLHQWLLSELDGSLIPSAHDRRLHDLLQAQRTTVAMHLDRARQLQQTLPR